MVSKIEQYNAVAVAIGECGSYELAYVSLELEKLYKNKYYFRNADDLYRAMEKRGFGRVSDIQEVIDKVKMRRG